MVTTMTRLTVSAALLTLLAASNAHAFTFESPPTPTAPSGSYGNTLTNPGSALATPEDQAKNFGSGTTDGQGGLSFRFGSANGQQQRLAPPAWSSNPLYLDRGE